MGAGYVLNSACDSNMEIPSQIRVPEPFENAICDGRKGERISGVRKTLTPGLPDTAHANNAMKSRADIIRVAW